MTKSPTPIKALLIDDSAVMRQVLQAILDQEPDIQVIAVASDPIFALHKMSKEWPDVIVLDVEMHRMDGITFLNKIMDEHPTPVVICSSFTEKGANTATQALASGAVEIISKPKAGLKDFFAGIIQRTGECSQGGSSGKRQQSDYSPFVSHR